MNKSYNGQFKQTRVRLNPIKKWSAAEEKALLEYLLNNNEIEKPNAQTYYRRFCDENKFNIPWKTVRTKVKNMRNSYFRTKAWEKEEANTLNKEQIEIGVLRKCSNFHELDVIFGNQIDFSRDGFFGSDFLTSIIIDSDDTSQKSTDDNLQSISRTSEPEIMEIKPDLVDIKPQQLDNDFSIKCMEMGVKETDLSFKDKINIMEIILKEKRLQLKEKQLISKEKIKIYEINSQQKLKILELEMKERLTSEELKLKYK